MFSLHSFDSVSWFTRGFKKEWKEILPVGDGGGGEDGIGGVWRLDGGETVRTLSSLGFLVFSCFAFKFDDDNA